MSPSIS